MNSDIIYFLALLIFPCLKVCTTLVKMFLHITFTCTSTAAYYFFFFFYHILNTGHLPLGSGFICYVNGKVFFSFQNVGTEDNPANPVRVYLST